jgi:hypothetical protein
MDLYGVGSMATAGVKELSSIGGSASVEAEREFIQVVVQMFLSHRSLVGTDQPPLE